MSKPKYHYEQLANAISAHTSIYNIPKNFYFYDTPNATFVFFLALNSTYTSTLYFASIPYDCDEIQFSPTPINLSLSKKKESKEEELLRERQRKFTIGVTEYYVLEDESVKDNILILIPASSSIFRVAININTQAITYDEINALNSSSVRMDAKWVPKSGGSFYSFTRDGELYLANNIDPANANQTIEYQISNSQSKGRRAGEAEYIIQEEFDRYTGYWWSEEVQSIDDKKLHTVFFIEVDDSKVKEYLIPESGIANGTSAYKYPFAGELNATNHLYLANVSIKGNVVEGSELLPLMFDLSNYYTIKCEEEQRRNPSAFTALPNDFKLEYVVRAGWVPRSGEERQKVWLQLLNRSQSILQLVHLDISAFGVDDAAIDLSSLISLVQIEISPIWINVTKIIEYLPDQSGRILWASERSGYRHLYLLTPSLPNTTYSARQLTSGNWIIDDESIWVDSARKLVYFYGTKDTPLEKHLYFTSFDDCDHSLAVHRLTAPNYFHSAAISKNFRYFTTTYSNTSTPYSTSLFKFDSENSSQRLIVQFDAPAYIPVSSESISSIAGIPFSFSPIQFFTTKSSATGEDLHGVVILPPTYKEGDAPLPTIVYVYGGPHVQLVTNDYRLINIFFKYQIYAALGFAVLIIDNVGSNRRGLQFEGHVKKRFGKFEVADQVDGVQYAISKGYTDPSRVLVTGWSYGGYMSLMCLAQRPDVFKIAVAGAPVVDWKGYDTGYTERYMGTPQENPNEYLSSSVISHVHGFPDEHDRLFIAHGLQDENVHFSHTSLLIEHLILNSKPYRLLFYPTERHGMRNAISAKYQERELLYISTTYL